jgi:hypothetical protein
MAQVLKERADVSVLLFTTTTTTTTTAVGIDGGTGRFFCHVVG